MDSPAAGRPRLAATCCSRSRRCATSGRSSCVPAAHSRKGVSLKASTTIRPRPQGSCVVGQGGGACRPVAQGESRRSSQPEGAIHSTRPMAKAACGRASSTAWWRSRPCRAAGRLLCASSVAQAARANRLLARPVHSDRPSAARVCRSCHSACQPCASMPACSACHRLQHCGRASRPSSSQAASRAGPPGVAGFSRPGMPARHWPARPRPHGPGRLPHRQSNCR